MNQSFLEEFKLEVQKYKPFKRIAKEWIMKYYQPAVTATRQVYHIKEDLDNDLACVQQCVLAVWLDELGFSIELNLIKNEKYPNACHVYAKRRIGCLTPEEIEAIKK